MKLLAVTILMLLLLLQTFSKWILQAEYVINKNYIAKNLCENKTKPKLHCNGKCQLMKKLAEEEKQNSSNPNSTNKLQSVDVLFVHKIQIPSIDNLPEENVPFHCDLIAGTPSPQFASIFHPPSAA